VRRDVDRRDAPLRREVPLRDALRERDRLRPPLRPISEKNSGPRLRSVALPPLRPAALRPPRRDVRRLLLLRDPLFRLFRPVVLAMRCASPERNHALALVRRNREHGGVHPQASPRAALRAEPDETRARRTGRTQKLRDPALDPGQSASAAPCR
jgi:hypothetical protein